MNWRIPLHHQRIWRCESQHLVCLCIGLLAQLLGGAIGLTSLEGLWSSFSHQFLTLTLASKTQSQAARQTSAKVLAKCLRETSKKDAFNIPWNVPMRCLKFDSLKFSLKKLDQRSMKKLNSKIRPQGFSGLAPVMKKTVACRNFDHRHLQWSQGDRIIGVMFSKSLGLATFYRLEKETIPFSFSCKKGDERMTHWTSNTSHSMTLSFQSLFSSHATKMSAVNEVSPSINEFPFHL